MPVITLNTFFGFVFGESAGPRLLSYGKGIFVLPARRAADEKATKDKKQAQFTFITENPTLSAEFRTMLRAQGNRDLENLLYDNTSDVLERSVNSGRYAIPSDDEIKEQFGKLEREYGYFGTDEKAFDNFVKLFKASKLIADYVEENNSTDNSVAYLHAYKMMVLFGANPFKSIETFVGTHAAKASKPIHDSLVLPIPKNSPPLKYLDQWQKLIIGSGSSVVSLFQQASEIEKILEAKEPFTFTLDSIKEAASQLAYKNYASNPELAKLCLQYHVEEENFNKCLEIKPKQSDNLPQVTVDGNTVGQRGYHLVKLPVDDPRAGILGKITNCCQSIGGHSEKCVIDGITRENNGFYVLLRAKSGRPKGATPPSPTRDDGRINYDNFEIVGQGYAWLSELNNLTLDSWENRTPSTDDAVIQAMLPEFAKQCFAQKPDIGRVTIGTGGKTPEVYKNAADKTAHPELMAEGYHYGDSSVQVAIALNPAVQEKAAAINAKLRDLDLDATVDICSIKQAEWFHELLEASTVSLYESTLGAGAYQKLLQKAATEPSVLDILFHLNQEEILIKKVTDLLLPLSGSESSGIARSVRCLTHAEPSLCTLDNFKRLVEPSVGVNDSQYIGVQLTRLSETGLLTDRNFNLVLSNREYAADVARILDKCEVRGGDLQFLIQKSEYASKICDGLSYLEKINPNLLTDKNLSLLAQNPQHISSLIKGLERLYKANPALMTAENRTLLTQDADHAEQLGSGLAVLYGASPDLMTAENRAFLIQDAKNARSLGEGLAKLYEANPVLITAENRTLLTQHAEHAQELGSGLASLYKSSPSLLADEKNITLLAQHAEYAYDLGGILAVLNKAEPSLLTDENRTFLAEHPESANAIKMILICSNISNPALITQDNFDLLMKLNTQKMYYLANSLSNFRYNQPNGGYQFVTDENFKFCALNPQVATKFSEGLALLSSQVDPCVITDEIRGFFLKYVDRARELAETIICLNKTNPELVTENNCKLIFESKDYRAITRTLDLLHKIGPGLITSENLELLSQQTNPLAFQQLLQIFKRTAPSLITEENLKLVTQYNGKYASKILDEFEEMIDERTDQTPKAIFEGLVAKIVNPPSKAAGNAASIPSQQQTSAGEAKPQVTTANDLEQDGGGHGAAPQ